MPKLITAGLMSACCLCSLSAAVPDAAGSLEVIGLPDYASKAPTPVFARNPWDMISFQGRIYVGGGDSDNGDKDGASSNPGNVYIISFAPGQKSFRYEGTQGSGDKRWIPSNQIDRFRVIQGQLWIPSHDPTVANDSPQLFRRDGDSTWTRLEGPDQGGNKHTFDLVEYGNPAKLFSTGNWPLNRWSITGTFETRVYGDVMNNRGSELISYKGKLYQFFDGSIDYGGSVSPQLAIYDPDSGSYKQRTEIGADHIAPGLVQGSEASSRFTARVSRSAAIDGRMWYIAGYKGSDHQMDPRVVITASSLDSGSIDTRNVTPTGHKPWDLLERTGFVWLLTSTKVDRGNGSDSFTAHIFKSNGTGWTEVVRASGLDSFARSFEEVNGDFYLGLGSDDGEGDKISWPESYTRGILPSCGTILRIPVSAYGTADPAGEVLASCALRSQSDLRTPFEVPLEQSTVGVPNQRLLQIRNAGVLGSTLRITAARVLAGQAVNATATVDLRGEALPISVKRLGTAQGVATIGINCTPIAEGIWSVPVQFKTDDADESTFRVVFSGSAEAAQRPEIRAVFAGTTLTTAVQTFTIAKSSVGQAKAVNIAIMNEGTSSLKVSSVDFITTQLTNCQGTRATAMPKTIAPGETLRVALAVTPSASGSWRAGLRLASNDVDEKTLVWRLEGQAADVVKVQAKAEDLPDEEADLDEPPLIDLEPPARYEAAAAPRAEGGDPGNCGAGGIALVIPAMALLALRRRRLFPMLHSHDCSA